MPYPKEYTPAEKAAKLPGEVDAKYVNQPGPGIPGHENPSEAWNEDPIEDMETAARASQEAASLRRQAKALRAAGKRADAAFADEQASGVEYAVQKFEQRVANERPAPVAEPAGSMLEAVRGAVRKK